ncbi:CpsD/CapB family tyrosine-protein kinase [Limnoglobus roseus]|uniref:Tyrosine-protein kinase (Capsular polysaccharide biosynthesis) n=1 Tax=Limnoglobus roseus TaxID=2598579 RepID=A0A5C1A490_9BACT|nr:CpsD/CapB family tyrosine-protein kinase [Limnoglobus roseus]QEL13175.1 Tyrosine-protein kinase (capsular polysaccharide biosynthesis) [Limnoglobus roseus]
MGRMFRIITEGSLDYPGIAATAPDSEAFVTGSAPYIEVGGPQPIFHGLPKLPNRVTAEKPVAILEAPKPVALPMPLPNRAAVVEDRYVSVKMHGIAPKPAAQPLPSTVHHTVVAYHHADHAVSHEYRGLCGELRQQVGTDNASKAILFTSAASDNGTTTVLLNLAVTLAKEPHTRVLVIDADFDRPGAAQKMGLSDVPGLAEVLNQTMPVAWVLQPTPVAKLQVLGAGRPTADTLPLMSTDFPKLVTQLRQWFDWILIDGGVWGERPHRDATSPAYDGVYLVTRQTEMDRPVFNTLRSQVAKHGGLLRGFITTRV